MPVREMRERVSADEWRYWNVFYARENQASNMKED